MPRVEELRSFGSEIPAAKISVTGSATIRLAQEGPSRVTVPDAVEQKMPGPLRGVQARYAGRGRPRAGARAHPDPHLLSCRAAPRRVALRRVASYRIVR